MDTDATRAEEERVLTELLRERLPRYPASEALKARVAAQARATAASGEPARRPLARLWALAALVLGVALCSGVLVLGVRRGGPAGEEPLVHEAVNDHLRLLYAQRPIEIESGGIHQVKPWFTGRLDFAPGVAFGGDADFPLVGGAVGYFVDRKAATFVFKRRLHTISVFVFRADGLPWTGRPSAAHPAVSTARGFQVAFFRSGDLGYALVSDVAAADLVDLARRLAP